MLPARERLQLSRDFKRVYAAKRAIVHPLMVLYTRSVPDRRRIGFSVSKKLGGAVRRNLIKRRLREASRACGPVLKSGFDAVIVARSRIADAPFAEIVRTLNELYRRAGLVDRGRISEQGERDGRAVEGTDPGLPENRETEP